MPLRTQRRGLPAFVGVPVAQGRADFRLLLVGHIDRLESRLDRNQYHRYEALAGKPGVTLFGPGISGYRPGMWVEEAVEIACGGIWPDIILHGMDFKESGIPLLTGIPEAPAITALELQDSWAVPERQVEFINRQRFDYGLLIVRHHIPYYQKHCPGTQFLWVPHAVNTVLFKNYDLPKVYDVLLYGNIIAHTYPLRARIAQLLSKSPLRFRLIPHPGYYPLQQGPNPEIVAGADLSREINKSWITIATSGIYQCLMMKYFEIAASYSLIAGDMPEEGRVIFGNDFIRLSNEQSDEEILSTLQRHLACKDRLLAMTDATHRRIIQNYSTDMFADRLLNDFRIIKAGRQNKRP